MTPNKTPIKKRIIYLLTMMNSITLFVLVGLFLIFFLFDIPLKHLFPFIVIYSFGIIALIMIDPKNTSFHSFPLNHRFAYSLLFITNIITVVLLFILLNRYSLGQYSIISIIGALIFINLTFLEYMHHPLQKIVQTSFGKWIFRTLLLAGATTLGFIAAEMLRETPPPIAENKTPKKTFSEVTGVLSTADPALLIETNTEKLMTEKDESLPESKETTGANLGKTNEITGEITTTLAALEKQGIKVESIESLDGRATMEMKNGELVVQVINPKEVTTEMDIPSQTATSGTGWYIRSSVRKAVGGGALQGVVIGAPVSLLPPGSHKGYQSIILVADGASNIYFTTDGSEPSCDGKGLTEKLLETTTLTLKAISCYGGDKIRGPIASYSYSLE